MCALLIDFFVSQNQFPQAYNLLRAMQDARIDIAPFVEDSGEAGDSYLRGPCPAQCPDARIAGRPAGHHVINQ